MARVFPVPIALWSRLFTLWVQQNNGWRGTQATLFADENNEDTNSEAILIGRREKVLAEAEKIGVDVWDFVVAGNRKNWPMIHHYFIAKDERELETKVAMLEVMSV